MESAPGLYFANLLIFSRLSTLPLPCNRGIRLAFQSPMKNLVLMRRAAMGSLERKEARAFIKTAIQILATLPRRRAERGIR